jgi:hypothetical protein
MGECGHSSEELIDSTTFKGMELTTIISFSSLDDPSLEADAQESFRNPEFVD